MLSRSRYDWVDAVTVASRWEYSEVYVVVTQPTISWGWEGVLLFVFGGVVGAAWSGKRPS